MARGRVTRRTDTAASADARTDPRADRSRSAGLEAARAILVEEGWDALTHLRVAERSDLHRATIYRHWPTPLALLHDVLTQEAALAQISVTGDLRTDLTAALDLVRHELEDRDFGRVLTALIDRAEWDTDIRDIKVNLAREALTAVEDLLRAAVQRGDLSPDLQPSTSVAQLIGPLLFRRLLAHETVTTQFIQTIIEGFLATYGKAARAGSSRGGGRDR